MIKKNCIKSEKKSLEEEISLEEMNAVIKTRKKKPIKIDTTQLYQSY